jgi:hypothetical protein
MTIWRKLFSGDAEVVSTEHVCNWWALLLLLLFPFHEVR